MIFFPQNIDCQYTVVSLYFIIISHQLNNVKSLRYVAHRWLMFAEEIKKIVGEI